MLLRARFLLTFSLPFPHSFPVNSFSITSQLKPTKFSSPATRSSSSSSASSSSRDASPPFGAALFIPPGLSRDDVTPDMLLPCSNILVSPYAGDARIKHAEFVKSSAHARDCPRDALPEFAVLGRSNVGKSSLINSLVRKKNFALTSKKPGKTQLINHFLVNKSWYIVDLPGYGFANASKSSQMDWSSFTKGYFLNRDTLVAVLLLVDASIPPQQIDLDCANWLGRNKVGVTFVFTKCDKVKGGKESRPDQNIKHFQDLISRCYKEPPPWIMTSSVTGLGRDELLLHMSQLRNYWDN